MMILRGSRESTEITRVFGLYDECRLKFGSADVWHIIAETFEFLPLCAVVGGQVFCVSGGIGRDLESLDDIGGLDRVQDIPREGPIYDLLYGGPHEGLGWKYLSRAHPAMFGQDVFDVFNHKNGLQMLIRGNQIVLEGYSHFFNRKGITLCSTPNFRKRVDNLGAFLRVEVDMNHSYHTYSESSESMKSLPVKYPLF